MQHQTNEEIQEIVKNAPTQPATQEDVDIISQFLGNSLAYFNS